MVQASNVAAPVPKKYETSLYVIAQVEAERHKWLESEKAGCDLGKEALQDWSRLYWWKWCRDRWIEHLNGERFWSELGEEDYGLLRKGFHTNAVLVACIVERIKEGGENLDIIRWVLDQKESLDQALEILTCLDINSRRLEFWPE